MLSQFSRMASRSSRVSAASRTFTTSIPRATDQYDVVIIGTPVTIPIERDIERYTDRQID
jgi:hypothetical protein